MSGTFSGFSEDDIKKLQNGLSVQNVPENAKQVKFASKGKKTVKHTVRFDESVNKTKNTNEVIDIPNEAKLCKPEVTVQTKADTEKQIEIKEECSTETKDECSTETKGECENKNIVQNNNKNEMDIVEKKFDLDESQTRQKLVEEQNRKRKELLSRALADKKKRTQAEAHRLNEIQNEFKKLDAMLSNDVKLLRQKIEMASITYMEAEKRYLRAEREFLDAKLALQQMLEKKELLTEHLCTIIEQNEERKGKKLMELLNKLDICDVDENKKSVKEATEQ